ncbi:hypothetical protein Vafri_5998 [Volvox africanus]|nr:hypothetical protein Vafri_5998 [Volvox africanus]
MVLKCVLRSSGGSPSLAEVSRLVPNALALRGFRADATDPELRAEDGNDNPCSTNILTDTHAGRSRHHASGAVSSETQQAAGQRGPVRAVQARKGERRKVLPVLAGDKFTSNVATLLVRWPHAAPPPSRLPRSWREVCDSEHFRRLFPLAAAGAYGNNHGEAGLGLPAAGDALPQQYDAHQAALLELVDRLQAVQQHLEDSMSNEGDGTIVALTFAHEEADDGGRDIDSEEEGELSGSSCHLRRHSGREGSPCIDGVGDAAGYSDIGSRKGSGAANIRMALGRCRRAPAGWQQGPRPAPPWDDTQPFQTNVGTVYHFWRLCPYG